MRTSKMRRLGAGLFIAVLVCQSSTVRGATVAYWRFEEGPDGGGVARGGMGDGVFFAGVADSSGNGNALSAWSLGWAGFGYRVDVAASSIPQTSAANQFSVQNTGSYPGMFTASGAPIQSITPAAFTIEASFKPETGGYRTIIGRDSRGATSNDGNLAALYFQIIPGDAVAIKYADVSGVWHEAISAAGVVKGFAYPNSNTGHWYHMAAVSNGSALSLYLNDVDGGGGYKLVAQTDMTTSGSPNTALTAGIGSGGDWTAGTWSVGRGLYAGGHGDRAYGFIDEVRISDSALDPSQFLFAYPPGAYMALSPTTLDAAPFDPPSSVNLVIPTTCNASQAVNVTITSDNPAVAKPAGSQGSAVVSYAVGDGATKPVSIEFGSVGQAHFTLSAAGSCPSGQGAALTVITHPVQSLSIQVPYGSMAVGGIQPATVIGDFGTVGTRDITLAAKGTTYTASPPGVLTVSADGMITAVGVGTATVKAINGGVTSPESTAIVVGTASSLAIAGPGVLLVDLKATDPTAGGPTWSNPGVLGDFASVGNPKLDLVAGVPAVTFTVLGDAYQGPLAPDALRTGQGWSVEVWAYNPSVDYGMECMVAWGYRGGPCGTNVSFGWGDHADWGAMAAWCTPGPDLGWGGGPPPVQQWRHLVYTDSYDSAANSTTVSVYDNGVLMNSEITNYQLVPHPGYINLVAQNLSANALDFFNNEWGMLSFANVRIHGGALTPEQVLLNYNAGIQNYVANEMSVAPRTVDAATVDPDETIAVTIPSGCNASQPVAVTVTSSNPAVVRPAGSNGSAVLNFTAGGPVTQTLGIDFVAPGEADISLSADKPCATGPLSTMHVTVHGPVSLDLRIAYDVMHVGQNQQASVIADFGSVGTRDITAGTSGISYAALPAGVVSVSSDGKISAVGLGTAAASATLAGVASPQRTVDVVTPGRLKVAGTGVLLVDLSSSDGTAGQTVWKNKGSLGDFTAIGQPVLETVSGEKAVSFNGADAYQGPLAPAELLGTQARTIEVWAFNPVVDPGIEAMVAWGHRGGPCGSNMTFGFGSSADWGAVGGWCTNGDLGWSDSGGSPPPGQWDYLVYTYDPTDADGTTHVYANGQLANSELSGAMPTNPGYIDLATQNLSANPMDVWLAGEMGTLSLAAVRIHDGALTPDQVNFNYRLGISGLGLNRADLDLDGFVNAADYVLFSNCALGPAIPLPENCRIGDLDDDGDGDQDDFGIFQRCFSGDAPAAAVCG